MLSKIQRTKVESKSQHHVSSIMQGKGCYQKYKEQKLKANHNYLCSSSPEDHVVIKNTKNKSWKQITTPMGWISVFQMLLSKIQRTKVESKSQHIHRVDHFRKSCYQKYKEQKLKANHNCASSNGISNDVVIKNTKNKSWKQITTASQM